MRRAVWRAGALLAAALPWAAPLRGQGLASPGPLSSAHAGLDNITRCLACHEAGRELSGRRCLACHVSLAERIRAGKGYHAVATRQGTALACASCHSEHNGRPYRMVRWEGGSADAFDHRRAGYALEGAHARVRCDGCHRAALIASAAVRADSSLSPARTYLGLGTACTSCHLDEHRGRLRRACTDCHTMDAWDPAPRFDHARTRFALAGRHRDVACARCHAVRRDAATGPGGARDTSFMDFRGGLTGRGSGCASCHESPHADRARMARCEGCHSVDGWFVLPDSIRNFDHATTGFALAGAHREVRCEGCHLSSRTAPLPRAVPLVRANFLRRFDRLPILHAACRDCHVDPHQGELPGRAGDCGACHDQVRFRPTTFAAVLHDRTRFPLTGAHGAVACPACHTPLAGAAARSGRLRFAFDDLRCTACHRDVHAGQFAGAGCDACHATSAWRDVAFDHERTGYPLRGAHRAVACSACHTRPAPGAAVRFRGLPTSCEAAGCHDDPHGGQFRTRSRGGACTACHEETAWRAIRFDHQTDTDWPLDGAHRGVACAACHRTEQGRTQWRPLPHTCRDCHDGGNR